MSERAEGGGPFKGTWPHPVKQFLWDLLPAHLAPEQSGLEAPDFVEPSWVATSYANTPEALEQARRAHEQERSRAEAAEAKAGRMSQTSLGLLTLAVALGGIGIGAIRDHGGGWAYLWLLPTALAIACLALAAIESLEIDRVGLYLNTSAGDIEGTAENLRRRQVREEERARQLAAWTAKQKLDTLLQARAWFSRGLVCLIIAGLVALGLTARQPAGPAPLESPSAAPPTFVPSGSP